jgi:hypothetical protein
VVNAAKAEKNNINTNTQNDESIHEANQPINASENEHPALGASGLRFNFMVVTFCPFNLKNPRVFINFNMEV